MGFFNKMSEPVFLKRNSGLEEQLEKLKGLEPLLNEEGKAKLRQDIRSLEAGILGEQNIAFELANSHMPMYIIHDLYLRDGDLTSQIDYLVVTRKICFVIECKNLYGNIEIDNQGTFVRTIEFGRQTRREGIYSPITQNQRHMALLRKLRLEQAKGFLSRFLRGRSFDEDHRAIVVLANPRTVLDARYAKKEVKSQVIRADHLVDFIRETCEDSRAAELSDKEMRNWAQSYLDMDQEQESDYLRKYEEYKAYKAPGRVQARDLADGGAGIRERIIKDLRSYRWNTSQAEGIKPYMVFNDKQMMDLLEKFPADKRELKQVMGFGDVKAEKYGAEIIEILDKYRG
ncbi:MAG: helicase [Hungatella sp.]|nr:helicase [Hungatella sp.]